MSEYQDGRVRLTVSYGYDIHSVEVLASTWLQIQCGEAVTVQGQGFSVEGEFSQDEWAFNSGESCSVQVTAEGGFVIFNGSLTDIVVN